jgi:hypothetical protein
MSEEQSSAVEREAHEGSDGPLQEEQEKEEDPPSNPQQGESQKDPKQENEGNGDSEQKDGENLESKDQEESKEEEESPKEVADVQEASDEGQKGQDPPAPQEGPTVPPEAHKSKEEPQSAEVKEDAERNPPPEQSQPSQDEQQQEKKEDTEQTVQSNTSGKETGEDRGDSATEKSKPGTAEEKVKEKKKKRAKSRDSTSGERKKEDMPKLKKRLSTAGSTVRSTVETVYTTKVFDDTINDMFTMADQKQQGYIEKDDFTTFLQSSHFQGCLDEAAYLSFMQYFDSAAEDGKMAYDHFSPVARELILRVYQVQDNSASEWVQLGDASGRMFWLNKSDGNVQFDQPADEAGTHPIPPAQQEMAQFMHQVYDQLDVVQAELERERLNNKELTNEINRLQEEMEKTHEALYLQGQTLDETTFELQTKDDTITGMKKELVQKESELESQRETVTQLESTRKELEQAQAELTRLRSKVSLQEGTITEKDGAISTLQQKCGHVTEQLKNTTGVLDVKEADLNRLNKDLEGERVKVKGFEKHVPKMEQKMKSLEEELAHTKQQLDEKVRSLQMSRKQLKSTRDRNLELEKEVEKLMVTKDKLQQSEGEVRTLKSFLVSKTALMDKKSRQIQELQSHMGDLEDKDQRRAVILASVLEKTARMQQERMSGATSSAPDRPSLVRSSSAPNISEERVRVVFTQPTEDRQKRVQLQPKPIKPWTTGNVGKTKRKKKVKKAHTLPRLPPLVSTKDKKDFILPTTSQIKERRAVEDKVLADHAFSNPQCQCAMCTLHGSMLPAGPTGHPTVAGTRGCGHWTPPTCDTH